MKRLLMMRTKGLLGPFFGKHLSVPGLSRSKGASFSFTPPPPVSNVVTHEGVDVTYLGDVVTHED
jgi:hypothetical protein